MIQAEACPISLWPGSADVGGRIIVYRVTVRQDGSVSTLDIVERDRFLAGFFVLDGLEECIRRWRFGNSGVHTLAVDGGFKVVPAIHVIQGRQAFRLRLHYSQTRR